MSYKVAALGTKIQALTKRPNNQKQHKRKKRRTPHHQSTTADLEGLEEQNLLKTKTPKMHAPSPEA
jgi:hypothetical protein